MRFHLAAHRRRAESLMTDSVIITRIIGTEVGADGRERPKSTPVYQGRAALGWEGSGADVEVAGATVTIRRQVLKLPIGDYVPRKGDRAEFVPDCSLAGVVVALVANGPVRSNAIQWRIPVERIS